MFLLISSITIANFSAYAQTTPRPYYTVNQTPTHFPPVLYENTPVDFITKVTNTGTASKARDVFVKMSHVNEAGEHSYTCDAASGAYSQSVNLVPGESIDLYWKCEIFNSGTYTLTILDKTFTYTVISGTTSSNESDKQNAQQQESYNKEIQTTQPPQNSQQTSHQGEVIGQSHIVVLKVYTQPRKDIKAGSTIDISAHVKNLGEYRGTKKIDGTLTWYSAGVGKSTTLSSKTVTLDPQEETFLDWKKILVPKTGSYDITIAEGGVQFTVKETKKKSDSKDTEEKKKEDRKKAEEKKKEEDRKKTSTGDGEELQTKPAKVFGNVADFSGNLGIEMPGLTVTLQDSSGTKTTKTDKAGKYRFENVAPGSTKVILTIPNGYTNPTKGGVHEFVVESGNAYMKNFVLYKIQTAAAN